MSAPLIFGMLRIFKALLIALQYRHRAADFGVSGKDCGGIGYDASGCNKEEQMYAFYLAYKHGARGYLMDEFKRAYLLLCCALTHARDEARRRAASGNARS